MYNLAKLFEPIIAKPHNTGNYIEIPPCDLLKPYIRCFWGTPRPAPKIGREDRIHRPTLIIPDACMDLIVDVDYRHSTMKAVFCGINDGPFSVADGCGTGSAATFAIRFHFWAVHLFVDMDMREALNAFVDSDQYFRDFKQDLAGRLAEKATIGEQIAAAEQYLLARLDASRRTNSDVLNAVYFILRSRGLFSVPGVSKRVNSSQRRLERLFAEFVGVSPKKAADLVRFQNVWQAMYYAREPNFCDIAYHYHFTDQAHFNNNFKKYAGRTPLEALRYANS